MACSAPQQEWTIRTTVENRTAPERTLVFCLTVEKESITGVVDTLLEGERLPLSEVTGTSQPLTALNQGFENPPTLMTLNFAFGELKALFFGTTFKEGNLNKILGRFVVFNSLTENNNVEPENETEEEPNGETENDPEDVPRGGDVGTGAGTQT